MVSQYLAAHRFGLGPRADAPAPANPATWLAHQIDAFDPKPPALSVQPGRPAIAAAYTAYREERQAVRRTRRDDAPAAAPMEDAASADAAPERAARIAIRGFYRDAVEARLAQAVATPTPFAERLVHFWSNHFAISADKQLVVGFAGNYEFEAIRPHIMGKFADLLIAAVRHPAMLLYLDQAQSIGPDSPMAARIKARRPDRANLGLNENLAREIMELHTLGVRSGYSQADVTAFAKALTGWTVAGVGRGASARLKPADAPDGDAIFIPRLHQPGRQSILGKAYDQPGAAQAEAVLRDLAVHPATAGHIATKLARHFAGDTPPTPLVERLKANFLESGGDLPALYRTLIASPEVWAAQPAMFKSPWDWMAAMLRALPASARESQRNIAGMFVQLGQPIWRPGSPAGYDDRVATWAGSAALMQRVELASRIAGRIGDRVDARQLAPLVLADGLAPVTAQAIARADSPGQGLALLFASPAFLRR
ncbi:DUF1800 domain-containing protein [Sphingopyxis sp. MWB1]|uniref:DUF1800 domain-containing protein n=1 Tax=Sphingopyxis sp. MWB1 TaxID=1537715 RepID=UPI00051A3034|nr:DUF1800 domain-containing protein [Sphingopyxis sp. MWB1]